MPRRPRCRRRSDVLVLLEAGAALLLAGFVIATQRCSPRLARQQADH